MAIDVQAEALRRKSAGDPRPLAMIVAELSAVPQASMAPAPQAMTPTPGQPVPVGEQVNIQTQATLPPMTTPFNPVAKAREAAAPKVEQVAETSATDAAVKQAQQQGNPNADMLAQADARRKAAYEDEVAARQKIRDTVGVPKELEAIFKSRDERYIKQEADIAEDEKKQVWNALAMAGFQMAQSTSPYFLAALSAGMQSGLEGYSSSKAALAEKKARLMDAKDNVALDRYKTEKAAENEELGNIDAARAAASRDQADTLRYLEAAMAQELQPLKRAQMQAQIDQIRANIRNDNIRTGLAQSAAARAAAAGRAAGGNALAKARAGAESAASKWAIDQAEKALEAENVTRDDPKYGQKLALKTGQYRNVFYATNPVAAQTMGYDPRAIKLDFEKPKVEEEEERGFLSRIFGFK